MNIRALKIRLLAGVCLLLTAVCPFTSHAVSSEAVAVLRKKISESELSSEGRWLIYNKLPGRDRLAVTIEDLVGLRAASFRRDPTYSGLYVEDYLSFLRPYGLRLGLTSEEIEGYRQTGTLPDPTGDSYIDALDLSGRAYNVLDGMGVVHLDDAADLTLEEIDAEWHSGDSVVSHIDLAFTQAGFPLARDSADLLRRSETALTGREQIPIKNLGLTAKTVIALQNDGFYTVEQLMRLTEARIDSLPGLGSALAAKLRECLKEHGIVLSADALTLAIQTGIPYDPKLKIAEHVMIRKIFEHTGGQSILKRLAEARILTLGQLAKADRSKMKPIHYGPLEWSELQRLFGLIDQAHMATCNGALGVGVSVGLGASAAVAKPAGHVSPK